MLALRIRRLSLDLLRSKSPKPFRYPAAHHINGTAYRPHELRVDRVQILARRRFRELFSGPWEMVMLMMGERYELTYCLKHVMQRFQECDHAFWILVCKVQSRSFLETFMP